MKKRLDLLVVEKQLAETREKAKSLIRSGLVSIDGKVYDRPSMAVAENAQIEIKEGGLRYVSRGGLKLEKALAVFPVDLRGKVCTDIGASTGGFTDCMLQNAAARVYAVDVGTNQLSPILQADPRVISLEETNARYLTREDIPEEIFFASIDVSFISLMKVLPPIHGLLQEGGYAACLIKPQFEAGREKIGKKGVVRDPRVHAEVIEGIVSFALSIGFSIVALTHSPIKGPQGNIEYLVFLRKESAPAIQKGVLSVKDAVTKAHQELGRASRS